MKKLLIPACCFLMVLCTGCSGDKELSVENGKVVIDLPQGEKFVSISSDRFFQYVVHRKRRADEAKEEYLVDKVDLIDKDQHSEILLIREH